MDAIHALASRIGAAFSPEYNRWTISDMEMARWFRANCYKGVGAGALIKRVPEILFHVAKDQIERFLWMYGDKTTRPDGTRQYCSISRGLIDDLQRLLLITGKRGAIFTSGKVNPPTTLRNGSMIHSRHPIIFLSEHKEGYLWLKREEQAIVEDHYKGEIFCATVPNGTLVTRRNGSILISGNCERVIDRKSVV